MANQKNTKTIYDDSILFYKRIMDGYEFPSPKVNQGKTKQNIRKPGHEMVDAVTKLIFHFEKKS